MVEVITAHPVQVESQSQQLSGMVRNFSQLQTVSELEAILWRRLISAKVSFSHQIWPLVENIGSGQPQNVTNHIKTWFPALPHIDKDFLKVWSLSKNFPFFSCWNSSKIPFFIWVKLCVWCVFDAWLEQNYGRDQRLLSPRRACTAPPKDVNEISWNCVEIENTSTPLFK